MIPAVIRPLSVVPEAVGHEMVPASRRCDLGSRAVRHLFGVGDIADFGKNLRLARQKRGTADQIGLIAFGWIEERHPSSRRAGSASDVEFVLLDANSVRAVCIREPYSRDDTQLRVTDVLPSGAMAECSIECEPTEWTSLRKKVGRRPPCRDQCPKISTDIESPKAA